MVPRRHFLLLLVIAAGVLLAGCSAENPEAGPTEVPSQSPTPPTEREVPSQSPTPTEREHHTVAPEDRLVIDTVTSEDVTVSLYEYRGDGRTPNSTSVDPENWERVESATYSGAGQIRVDDFEVDGHVVLSRDDTVLWEGPIAPYEHVELWIDAEGDVSVTDHFVL